MVDYVSPDGITVALDTGAPESIALNTGVPRPFPRVNGYLLVPVDDAFLVGQVEWLAVGSSSLPKRQDKQRDSGLVDLPYPLRKLRLNPLGTIRISAAGKYVFSRGADALPTVGVAVVLPTKDQIRSIIESGEHRRVKIGTSPLADHADVYIDPDRLFGRHLAVLGNTGSGKSCSVAGLIRWNIEKAKEKKQAKGLPNARFIVLDPNGEYSHAFGVKDKSSDNPLKARIFKVNPDESKDELPLQVPLWFWNSAEWCSFTQASAKAQRPALMQALRFAKDGHTNPSLDESHEMRVFLRTLVTTIRVEQKSGAPWGTYGRVNGFYDRLEKWHESLKRDLGGFQGDQHNKLEAFVDNIAELCEQRRATETNRYPNIYNVRQQVEHLLVLARDAHSAFGGADKDTIPVDVDAPRPFKGESLLRCLEAAGEMLKVSEHIEPLLARIRALLTDTRMKPIVDDASDVHLNEWLESYIGSNKPDDSCVSVIDLSLVPTEVVHVVTAVIARMVFEAQQRYMKSNQNERSLPTVIVMEEAHTFVKKYKDDVEYHDAARICCHAFERIAREGRKFGLGLVLSSQRPSELSPTVFSQCNSFLLHRISNDRDQDRVQRMVPDNLQGVLRELPLLPSQNAILLGWASELPVLVRMTDLPEGHRPRSDDPDFWDVWAGNKPRKINWKEIADKWQRVSDKNKEAGEP